LSSQFQVRGQLKVMSRFKAGSPFKMTRQFKVMSLSAMDLPNGHAAPTPKDLLELILLFNLMGPCSVLLIIPSTHRSVGWSAMGLCECSMLHGSVSAGAALYAHSVKKTTLPPNRDG
jgi:hypothetical protein